MWNLCAGLTAAALIVSTAAALADDNTGVCVTLESQLAQIDRGPAPGQDPHQYDEPIARQQDQIDRATDEAHQAGCMGGFLFFRRDPAPECGGLMASISKMQANMQRLLQAQIAVGGGDSFALGQRRDELLRQLSYNRCAAAGQPTGPVVEDSGGSFLRQLFGGGVFQPQAPDASAYGTYRTLCVRTCDGYYFPISFSTVPGQFNTDAATCQQMCPGAEVSLYTYRNPGGDVSQMVSLDGQPYTALPAAFKYRSSYDKACTCHAAAPASIAAGGPVNFTEFPTDGSALYGINPPPLGAPATTAAAPPAPHLRPRDPDEDPTTVDDRAVGLVPAPVTKMTEPAAQTASDAPRKVRIVGPNYYYGQQN